MSHASTSAVETPLYVKDGCLALEEIGRLRPSSPCEPLEELHRRYRDDGYLFVKGLLSREDVLQTRKAYFDFLAPSGVLDPGTAPVDGVFDPSNQKEDFPGIGAGSVDANGRPRGGLFVDLALRAHNEPWYKDVFCQSPGTFALLSFVSRFTGWDKTLGLQRTLLRNNTPGNPAIGVHYDQIFLRHGEDTSLTAWVPIGDIALDGGGLIYLERSPALGAAMEQEFTKEARASGLSDNEARDAFNRNMMSGGMLSDAPREFATLHGRRWLVTEYEAGDVVFHTPYTIHASTMNYSSKNTIRLATDLRFVDSSRPYDKRWTNTYKFGDGA